MRSTALTGPWSIRHPSTLVWRVARPGSAGFAPPIVAWAVTRYATVAESIRRSTVARTATVSPPISYFASDGCTAEASQVASPASARKKAWLEAAWLMPIRNSARAARKIPVAPR